MIVQEVGEEVEHFNIAFENVCLVVPMPLPCPLPCVALCCLCVLPCQESDVGTPQKEGKGRENLLVNYHIYRPLRSTHFYHVFQPTIRERSIAASRQVHTQFCTTSAVRVPFHWYCSVDTWCLLGDATNWRRQVKRASNLSRQCTSYVRPTERSNQDQHGGPK